MLWSLNDSAIQEDLVLLSENMENDRMADGLTDDFLHGRALPCLYAHCCDAIAPLATSCFIAELVWSFVKETKEENETRATTDMKMACIFDILMDLRDKRRELTEHWLLKDGGRGGHLETKQQVHEMCKQLVTDVLPRYDAARMGDIPPRRELLSELKDADRQVAIRGTDQREEQFSQSGRARQSAQEWNERLSIVGKRSTRIEVTRNEIKALTPSERNLAVIVERKVKGQIDNVTAFWSKIKSASLSGEVKNAMPLIHAVLEKVKSGEASKVKGKAKKQKCLSLKDDYTAALKGLVRFFFVAPPECSVRKVKYYSKDHGFEESTIKMCPRCEKVHLGGCVMCYLIPEDSKQGNYFDRVLIRHWKALEKRDSQVSKEANRRKG